MGVGGLKIPSTLLTRSAILSLQPENTNHNSSLLHRVNNLEIWASESSTLQHLQATYIYDIQAQVRNLSLMIDGSSRNSSCSDPAPLRSHQPHPHIEGNKLLSDLRYSGSCYTDCANHYYNGERSSGIYTIAPSTGGAPTDVYCDMDTDGGGWTVIQRRQDGSVNFTRTWTEYKEGFGNLNGEFWLGNENIHRITQRGGFSLRIDMEDWSGHHKYAVYREFSIEDETNSYRLHVSGAGGTADDSFAWYHNKKSFSTPESGNLPLTTNGGKYVKGRRMMGPDGVVWYSWLNTDYYSLKKVSMMIRPRSFHLSP
uniref:Fibrinogen C-terminal domain-containing protein n=1 Tax=Pyxicephalus adspersus TaxID=30357 RepID=A0AAV3AEQ9_PYXAD|nr:TPA: hypothetical protein GDO54_009836 [Pyxicephalus adspersus]